MYKRLYQNELTHLGYGKPVWEPDPDILYDRVRIGDVGYFEKEKFLPLFNILPPDDSTRNRHLPFLQPNFPALNLPDDSPTSHFTKPLQAGVHAPENSFTFPPAVGVDRVGSVLHGQSSRSFTNERGAALILRYEALREDTLYGNFFKKHMLKYYRQWYNFALTECYRDIRICDLILVTGCDLTPQWATAIYVRNNQEINAASRAQVRSVAEVKFSLSAASRTLYSNTRRGPSQALHQQDRDETQNDRKTLVNNQCIFIRGIYIKDRFEEDGDGVVGDEYVTVESFPPKTRDETFITVLLDYMLEESIADVVIATDSDLWPYLGEAENPEDLRETLKRMSPRINVEDGVGSLPSQAG